MASSKNLQLANALRSDSVGGNTPSNISQADNHSVTNTGNQELNHRIKILEDLLNERLNKENIENIENKQLRNKVEKLEEQVVQHTIQIKHLEDKLKSE
jgi:hypothetical protein